MGKEKKNGSMPKGAYKKGQSCGRGKHTYVKSPDGKYAICSKCFSRRGLTTKTQK